MPTLDINIEKVTPQRAAELLRGNTINRSLRPKTVKRYARDMTDGHWQESGDPIRLDRKGTLLDGQHRLSAIIESGISQKMVVVNNVDTRSILTMDTGNKRTFSDVLKIQGHTNVMNLAALARWCVLYEDELRTPTKDQATHAEMMAWLDRNLDAPEIVRSICATSNHPILKRVRMPLTALKHYAENGADFELFMSRLRAGTGLVEGDPIHTLRRFVENLSITKPPLPIVIQAITIKAWNAYMEGREVQLLAYRPGGAAPESFPVILTKS